MSNIIETKISITRVPQKVKDGVSIYSRIHYKGSDVKIATGIKIKSRNWNKSRKTITGDVNLSNHLADIEHHLLENLKEIINENPNLHISHIVDIFKGKTRVGKKLGIMKGSKNKSLDSQVLTLPNLIDEYIESKSKINTKKNSRTLKSNLLSFLKTKNITGIPLNSFSEDLIRDFLFFLQNKELSINYIERLLNNMKTVLNWGYKNKFNIDPEIVNFVSNIKNSIGKDKPKMVTLFIDEFKKIKEYKPENPRISKIKDSYIFMCKTGQRLSDYKALNKDSIIYSNKSNLWYWEIKQIKVDTNVLVPLNQETYNILKKYNFKLPLHSKSNKDLKELAKEVGLDREIVENTTRNNKRIITKYKLYDIISLHSSRKTFVTVGIQSGINDHVITKVTGHSSIKEFKKYVGIHNDDIKNLIDVFN